MTKITGTTVNKITTHIHNGNWVIAKSLIQYKCKHNPERQAHRLTRVAIALIDENFKHLAFRLLDMFDKEQL